MAEVRQAVSQLPPLNLTDAAAKFNAYSGRRGFVGVAETLEPKLVISERYAPRSWRLKGMPSHYFHSKMMESYKVKKVVGEAVRLTAVAFGNWDFRWGDIPARVPDITALKTAAQLLSADIMI